MDEVLELGSPKELSVEVGQRLAAARTLRSVLSYVFPEPQTIRAVELFAGDGGWVTSSLLEGLPNVVLVERSTELCDRLRRSWQGASVIACDSIEDFELVEKYVGSSEIVCLDNPSAIFGDRGHYCEHFDLLPLVLSVKSPAQKVLIFNVNTRPFSVESFPTWADRRENFYYFNGSWSLGDFVSFYEELSSTYGWNCEWVVPVPRRGTFLWLFALCLSLK